MRSAGGHVTIAQSSDAHELRRLVGVTAWVVLEALTVEARFEGDRLYVEKTSRDLAVLLAIGKDRAAAAVRVLRDAGILVQCSNRSSNNSRFAPSRYEIRIPTTPIAKTKSAAAKPSKTKPTAQQPPVGATPDSARVSKPQSKRVQRPPVGDVRDDGWSGRLFEDET